MTDIDPGMPSTPGSAMPLAAGEWVLLTDRKRRRYLFVLTPGSQWHSHAGTLDHDDLIGACEGRSLRTSKNMEVTALRPTLSDYVLKMKRGAQVVYPKDQAMIMSLADIRPGMTVVEAGAGSGALSMALLDAVGPAGRVVSFDHRQDHLDIAASNVAGWFGTIPPNWDLVAADVIDGLASLTAHRVVLDLLEPWAVVEAAATALAPGGILAAYMPTITQVMRLDMALRTGIFAGMATTETLVRGWDVDNLTVRPHHRMVAHTAFITIARRGLSADDGGPPRPAGVTGATVSFVDAPGETTRVATRDTVGDGDELPGQPRSRPGPRQATPPRLGRLP